MDRDRPPAAVAPLVREGVVPALMLVGVGLYAWGSRHVSVEGLVFPAALILVTIVALAAALFTAIKRRDRPLESGGEEGEEAGGPLLEPKAWLLVVLPAALLLAFELVGALAGLVVLVFGVQLVFDRCRPLTKLAFALAITLPVYVLFKYVLYVRFPAGLLGIG